MPYRMQAEIAACRYVREPVGVKLQAAGGRENIRLGKPLDPHIHAKGLRGLLISSYIDLLEQVAPVLPYMVVLILFFFFFNKWDQLYLPKQFKSF